MAESGVEPTLRTYLMVLRRRKWWIITIALLGLGVSLAMSLSQHKQYSAVAQLLVQPTGSNLTVGSAETQVTPTQVQTEMQLVTSAEVEQTVRRKLGSAPLISAAEVAQTNVIALTAKSSSPVRAADIANAYAKAFVDYTTSVTVNNLTAAEHQLRQQLSAISKEIKALPPGTKSASQVTALANQEAVLKEQVAQLEVNSAVASAGVEFVTPAQPPMSPSSPKPVQNALFGLAAGLVLGLGAAFLRDSFDDALTSSEAVERVSGAPVLAMVPMVSTWKRRETPLVISAAEPSSQAAEAYRSLRTSLQFARQAGDLRTLLVTSPVAAEGKTSTLANLGAVFAQAGERVVLVSCDLRRPRLGKFFGFDEQNGLTNVLLGRSHLNKYLALYAAMTPCGRSLLVRSLRIRAELLTRDQTRDIFDTLQENFDLVIIDSPPVLPVTDAMILYRYADGALLVVAAGQTRRAQLRRTVETFTHANAPIVGLVLNEVTRQTGYASGYGSGYGDRYGYVSHIPSARAGHANDRTNTKLSTGRLGRRQR